MGTYHNQVEHGGLIITVKKVLRRIRSTEGEEINYSRIIRGIWPSYSRCVERTPSQYN